MEPTNQSANDQEQELIDQPSEDMNLDEVVGGLISNSVNRAVDLRQLPLKPPHTIGIIYNPKGEVI